MTTPLRTAYGNPAAVSFSIFCIFNSSSLFQHKRFPPKNKCQSDTYYVSPFRCHGSIRCQSGTFYVAAAIARLDRRFFQKSLAKIAEQIKTSPHILFAHVCAGIAAERGAGAARFMSRHSDVVPWSMSGGRAFKPRGHWSSPVTAGGYINYETTRHTPYAHALCGVFEGRKNSSPHSAVRHRSILKTIFPAQCRSGTFGVAASSLGCLGRQPPRMNERT